MRTIKVGTRLLKQIRTLQSRHSCRYGNGLKKPRRGMGGVFGECLLHPQVASCPAIRRCGMASANEESKAGIKAWGEKLQGRYTSRMYLRAQGRLQDSACRRCRWACWPISQASPPCQPASIFSAPARPERSPAPGVRHTAIVSPPARRTSLSDA